MYINEYLDKANIKGERIVINLFDEERNLKLIVKDVRLVTLLALELEFDRVEYNPFADVYDFDVIREDY